MGQVCGALAYKEFYATIEIYIIRYYIINFELLIYILVFLGIAATKTVQLISTVQLSSSWGRRVDSRTYRQWGPSNWIFTLWARNPKKKIQIDKVVALINFTRICIV